MLLLDHITDGLNQGRNIFWNVNFGSLLLVLNRYLSHDEKIQHLESLFISENDIKGFNIGLCLVFHLGPTSPSHTVIDVTTISLISLFH